MSRIQSCLRIKRNVMSPKEQLNAKGENSGLQGGIFTCTREKEMNRLCDVPLNK